MADMHTGLGHDLPEYAAATPRTQVRISKDCGRWVWRHHCGQTQVFWYWDNALLGALAHLGRCSK